MRKEESMTENKQSPARMERSKAMEVRLLLLEAVEPIIKHKGALARGEESPLKDLLIGKNEMKEIWEAVIPMLQKVEDTSKIEAETIADVMHGLREGNISPAQANNLMAMVEKAFEMTELKNMSEKLDAMEGN